MKTPRTAVEYRIIANLPTCGWFSEHAMAEKAHIGDGSPANDAGHDFWRVLDKVAAEYGYHYDPSGMLYVNAGLLEAAR